MRGIALFLLLQSARACGLYRQDGYQRLSSDTEIEYMDGDVVAASDFDCILGYTSGVSAFGAPKCLGGAFQGEFSGCYKRCNASLYPVRGYKAKSTAPPSVSSGTAFFASDFVCDTAAGFSGTVAGSAKCSDATFSSHFTGCARACPPSYTQVGYKISSTTSTAHGSSLPTPSCDAAEGYGGVVGGTVYCVDGKWTGEFSGCGVPCTVKASDLPRGFLGSPGALPKVILFGTTVVVGDFAVCDAAGGYGGTPSGTLTCAASSSGVGVLVPAFGGCYSECRVSYSQAGYHIRTPVGVSEVPHKSLFPGTVSCDEGFTVGSGGVVSTLVCHDGVWEGQLSGCVRSCVPLAHPAVRASSPPSSLSHGGKYTASQLTCLPSLRAAAGALTCEEGEWVGMRGTKCGRGCGYGWLPRGYGRRDGAAEKVASGASFTTFVACAAPAAGVVAGNATCVDGEVEGVLSGCGNPCVVVYSQVGYVTPASFVSVPHGGSVVSTDYACESGYTSDGGGGGGGVECVDGTWVGRFLHCQRGCSHTYLQSGYRHVRASALPLPHGGALNGTDFACDAASGAVGTPGGSVVCRGGHWIGLLSGCIRACNVGINDGVHALTRAPPFADGDSVGLVCVGGATADGPLGSAVCSNGGWVLGSVRCYRGCTLPSPASLTSEDGVSSVRRTSLTWQSGGGSLNGAVVAARTKLSSYSLRCASGWGGSAPQSDHVCVFGSGGGTFDPPLEALPCFRPCSPMPEVEGYVYVGPVGAPLREGGRVPSSYFECDADHGFGGFPTGRLECTSDGIYAIHLAGCTRACRDIQSPGAVWEGVTLTLPTVRNARLDPFVVGEEVSLDQTGDPTADVSAACVASLQPQTSSGALRCSPAYTWVAVDSVTLVPPCVLATSFCPPYQQPGYAAGDGVAVGKYLESVQCADGWSGVVDGVVRCTSAGTYEGRLWGCKRGCSDAPSATLVAGFDAVLPPSFAAAAGAPHGGTVEVVCAKDRAGTAYILVCYNGGWTWDTPSASASTVSSARDVALFGVTPSCPSWPPCDVFSFTQDGYTSVPTGSSTVLHGSTLGGAASLSCDSAGGWSDAGTGVVGGEGVVCVRGVWRGEGSLLKGCVPPVSVVACGTAPPAAAGYESVYSGSGAATYVCADGYSSDGSVKGPQCLNGRWAGRYAGCESDCDGLRVACGGGGCRFPRSMVCEGMGGLAICCRNPGAAPPIPTVLLPAASTLASVNVNGFGARLSFLGPSKLAVVMPDGGSGPAHSPSTSSLHVFEIGVVDDGATVTAVGGGSASQRLAERLQPSRTQLKFVAKVGTSPATPTRAFNTLAVSDGYVVVPVSAGGVSSEVRLYDTTAVTAGISPPPYSTLTLPSGREGPIVAAQIAADDRAIAITTVTVVSLVVDVFVRTGARGSYTHVASIDDGVLTRRDAHSQLSHRQLLAVAWPFVFVGDPLDASAAYEGGPDPSATANPSTGAVLVYRFGKDGSLYVNPYTGSKFEYVKAPVGVRGAGYRFGSSLAVTGRVLAVGMDGCDVCASGAQVPSTFGAVDAGPYGCTGAGAVVVFESKPASSLGETTTWAAASSVIYPPTAASLPATSAATSLRHSLGRGLGSTVAVAEHAADGVSVISSVVSEVCEGGVVAVGTSPRDGVGSCAGQRSLVQFLRRPGSSGFVHVGTVHYPELRHAPASRGLVSFGESVATATGREVAVGAPRGGLAHDGDDDGVWRVPVDTTAQSQGAVVVVQSLVPSAARCWGVPPTGSGLVSPRCVSGALEGTVCAATDDDVSCGVGCPAPSGRVLCSGGVWVGQLTCPPCFCSAPALPPTVFSVGCGGAVRGHSCAVVCKPPLCGLPLPTQITCEGPLWDVDVSAVGCGQCSVNGPACSNAAALRLRFGSAHVFPVGFSSANTKLFASGCAAGYCSKGMAMPFTQCGSSGTFSDTLSEVCKPCSCSALPSHLASLYAVSPAFDGTEVVLSQCAKTACPDSVAVGGRLSCRDSEWVALEDPRGCRSCRRCHLNDAVSRFPSFLLSYDRIWFEHADALKPIACTPGCIGPASGMLECVDGAFSGVLSGCSC